MPSISREAKRLFIKKPDMPPTETGQFIIKIASKERLRGLNGGGSRPRYTANSESLRASARSIITNQALLGRCLLSPASQYISE